MIFTIPIFSIGKSHSQAVHYQITPNLGVSTPILDNGFGFQAGINGYYSKSPRAGLEVQVGYNHTFIRHTFISGKEGATNTFSAMAGARLYILARTDNKLYVHALAGVYRFHKTIQGDKFLDVSGFGLGGGLYYAIRNKWVIGLSIESPEHAVLKFGYNL